MDANEDAMNSSESRIVLVPKPDLREHLLEQMREEWGRSPHLRLTPGEVQDRWQLEPSTCRDLLSVLVDLRVITRDEDGRYSTAA
jgi:hypothetical protein